MGNAQQKRCPISGPRPIFHFAVSSGCTWTCPKVPHRATPGRAREPSKGWRSDVESARQELLAARVTSSQARGPPRIFFIIEMFLASRQLLASLQTGTAPMPEQTPSGVVCIAFLHTRNAPPHFSWFVFWQKLDRSGGPGLFGRHLFGQLELAGGWPLRMA